MKTLVLTLAALLWTAIMPPPEPDTASDDQVHFPALQTTIQSPEGDHGGLTECAVLGGKRLCDEDLGEAWCRKQGFGGGFVEWSTRQLMVGRGCNDPRACTVVTTITCKGVPIMGD